MSKRKKLPEQKCAYCGIGTKEDDAKFIAEHGIEFDVDHVIPQSFFNKLSGPPVYIKVPSCKTCNGCYKSQQDAFLRAVILLDEAAQRHPDSPELFDKVLRGLLNISWERREAISNAPGVFQATDSGLLVPTGKYAIKLDEDARNGLKMMVQGLYYHLWGKYIPIDCVTRLTNDPVVMEGFDQILSGRDFPHLGPFVVGNDVFRFVVYYAPDDPRVAIWIMQFYGSFIFVAFTDPRLCIEKSA